MEHLEIISQGHRVLSGLWRTKDIVTATKSPTELIIKQSLNVSKFRCGWIKEEPVPWRPIDKFHLCLSKLFCQPFQSWVVLLHSHMQQLHERNLPVTSCHPDTKLHRIMTAHYPSFTWNPQSSRFCLCILWVSGLSSFSLRKISVLADTSSSEIPHNSTFHCA